MTTHTDYQNLIYNSIAYLSSESNLSKCCCCNIQISLAEVKNHLQSSDHKYNISNYAGLSSSLDKYSLDYEKVFLNFIGISLPSLSKYNVNKFHAYCYKCLKVLSNGVNGINQHLRNGHNHARTVDSFCNDCLVHLNNIQNHIDGSDFHNRMVSDLLHYGKEISEISEIHDKQIEDIPSIFENMSHYRKIFITLVVLEMKCQRAYARNCRINNINIKWEIEEADVPGNKKLDKKNPIGNFKLLPSDDEYFKIKLYDELVVYLPSEGWSMCGTVKYIPTLFEDNDVQLELANQTGLKPHITFSYSITPKFTTTVFWRLRQALNKSISISHELQCLILNKVFDNNDPESDNTVLENIHTEGILNESQVRAVASVLKKKVTFIHGPPGTGKTLVSSYIVINLLLKNMGAKVLLCAPSNNAVNLLAERLDKFNINLVRIFSNHAEHADSAVKHLGLNKLALEKDESLCKDYDNYIKKNLPCDKYTDYKTKIESAKSAVLMERQVACTTLMSAASEELEGLNYDFILIDEASQSLEPETLLPLVIFNPKKVIFVGDHLQLGSLVISKKANDSGFGISMFERLIKQENISKVMLNLQYRMNPLIALFPNTYFYGSNLKNGVTVEERTLNLKMFNNKDKAVLFINIDGIERKFGHSLSNHKEATAIVACIRNLLKEDGITASHIGVITFYEGQNVTLHSIIKGESNDLKNAMISTVDSFQGQEKDIIILSFVRSNSTGDIGFLANKQRLNVALTRAKFKLIMFGHRKTLEGNTLYDSLFEYLDKKDMYYEENFMQVENNYTEILEKLEKF